MDSTTLGAAILEVVSDTSEWRLPPAAWTKVGSLMSDLERAWAGGDLGTAAAVLMDLELSGPVRIGRITAVPGSGPAPCTVDCVRVRLIHAVNGIGDQDPDPGRAAAPSDGPEEGRPAG